MQVDSTCQTPYWLPTPVFGGSNIKKAALVAALGQRLACLCLKTGGHPRLGFLFDLLHEHPVCHII